jgi:hypothetical protein
MRVTPLSAGYVKYTRAAWQAEEIDEPRDFGAITLQRKEWPVLPQIVGVESRLPPFVRFLQKKTGSR